MAFRIRTLPVLLRTQTNIYSKRTFGGTLGVFEQTKIKDKEGIFHEDRSRNNRSRERHAKRRRHSRRVQDWTGPRRLQMECQLVRQAA